MRTMDAPAETRNDKANRILEFIKKRGTVHLRRIIIEVGLPFSEALPILKSLEEKGLIEGFRHGGYTYYKITNAGKDFIEAE